VRVLFLAVMLFLITVSFAEEPLVVSTALQSDADLQSDVDADLAVNELLPNETVSIKPTSPLWSLKVRFERVRMLMSLNKRKKVELAVRYADKRLAEARLAIKKGDVDAARKALQEHNRIMKRVYKYVNSTNLSVEDESKIMNILSLHSARAAALGYFISSRVNDTRISSQLDDVVLNASVVNQLQERKLERLTSRSGRLATPVAMIVRANLTRKLAALHIKQAEHAIKVTYAIFGNRTNVSDLQWQLLHGAEDLLAKAEVLYENKSYRASLKYADWSMRLARQARINRPLAESLLSNANLTINESGATISSENWTVTVSPDKVLRVRNIIRSRLNRSRVCAQVITYAENPETGECESFPTPCDVPIGWKRCSPSTTKLTSESTGNYNNATELVNKSASNYTNTTGSVNKSGGTAENPNTSNVTSWEVKE